MLKVPMLNKPRFHDRLDFALKVKTVCLLTVIHCLRRLNIKEAQHNRDCLHCRTDLSVLLSCWCVPEPAPWFPVRSHACLQRQAPVLIFWFVPFTEFPPDYYDYDDIAHLRWWWWHLHSFVILTFFPPKILPHFCTHSLSQMRKALPISTSERLSLFHTHSQYLTWCQLT